MSFKMSGENEYLVLNRMSLYAWQECSTVMANTGSIRGFINRRDRSMLGTVAVVKNGAAAARFDR